MNTFDLSALLTQWNAFLIVAVWLGIQTVKRLLPDEFFDDGKPLARILPVLPMAICSVCVWVPGPWLSADETAAQRVILGIILGAVTANMHAIASRLGLHKWLGVEADTRKTRAK